MRKLLRRMGRLSGKKVASRRSAQQLVRSFFILITSVSIGSLAFAINYTKPTQQAALRTNLELAIQKPEPVITNVEVAQAHNLPLQTQDNPADMVGQASWYALGLPAPDTLTCASTVFRRGSYLHVRNLRNGLTVTCRVNDYGPEAWTNRVIDLSRGSFRQIEDLSRGVAPVEVRLVSGTRY